MKKGKVLKIVSEYSIVLTDKKEYYKIKNKNGLELGHSIYFFEEDILKSETTNLPSTRMVTGKKGFKPLALSGLAACLVLVFWLTGMFGMFPNQAYFAMISLDINPSIQLEVDQRYIVMQARALNEDGKKVIAGKLKGQSLEKALDILLKNAHEQKYLTAEEDTVLVSAVMSPDYQQIEDEFIENLNKTLTKQKQDQGYDFVVIQSDSDSYNEAKNEGVSVGKYKLYQMSDGNLTLDQVKSLKVREMLSIPEIKEKIEGKDSFAKVMEEEKEDKDNSGQGEDSAKEKKRKGKKQELEQDSRQAGEQGRGNKKVKGISAEKGGDSGENQNKKTEKENGSKQAAIEDNRHNYQEQDEKKEHYDDQESGKGLNHKTDDNTQNPDEDVGSDKKSKSDEENSKDNNSNEKNSSGQGINSKEGSDSDQAINPDSAIIPANSGEKNNPQNQKN